MLTILILMLRPLPVLVPIQRPMQCVPVVLLAAMQTLMTESITSTDIDIFTGNDTETETETGTNTETDTETDNDIYSYYTHTDTNASNQY